MVNVATKTAERKKFTVTNDPGEWKMPFGKHKGKTLNEIFRGPEGRPDLAHPAYLDWLGAQDWLYAGTHKIVVAFLSQHDVEAKMNELFLNEDLRDLGGRHLQDRMNDRGRNIERHFQIAPDDNSRFALGQPTWLPIVYGQQRDTRTGTQIIADIKYEIAKELDILEIEDRLKPDSEEHLTIHRLEKNTSGRPFELIASAYAAARNREPWGYAIFEHTWMLSERTARRFTDASNQRSKSDKQAYRWAGPQEPQRDWDRYQLIQLDPDPRPRNFIPVNTIFAHKDEDLIEAAQLEAKEAELALEVTPKIQKVSQAWDLAADILYRIGQAKLPEDLFEIRTGVSADGLTEKQQKDTPPDARLAVLKEWLPKDTIETLKAAWVARERLLAPLKLLPPDKRVAALEAAEAINDDYELVQILKNLGDDVETMPGGVDLRPAIKIISGLL